MSSDVNSRTVLISTVEQSFSLWALDPVGGLRVRAGRLGTAPWRLSQRRRDACPGIDEVFLGVKGSDAGLCRIALLLDPQRVRNQRGAARTSASRAGRDVECVHCYSIEESLKRLKGLSPVQYRAQARAASARIYPVRLTSLNRSWPVGPGQRPRCLFSSSRDLTVVML
jgi:hypothetical protein